MRAYTRYSRHSSTSYSDLNSNRILWFAATHYYSRCSGSLIRDIDCMRMYTSHRSSFLRSCPKPFINFLFDNSSLSLLATALRPSTFEPVIVKYEYMHDTYVIRLHFLPMCVLSRGRHWNGSFDMKQKEKNDQLKQFHRWERVFGPFRWHWYLIMTVFNAALAFRRWFVSHISTIEFDVVCRKIMTSRVSWDIRYLRCRERKIYARICLCTYPCKRVRNTYNIVYVIRIINDRTTVTLSF